MLIQHLILGSAISLITLPSYHFHLGSGPHRQTYPTRSKILQKCAISDDHTISILNSSLGFNQLLIQPCALVKLKRMRIKYDKEVTISEILVLPQRRPLETDEKRK